MHKKVVVSRFRSQLAYGAPERNAEAISSGYAYFKRDQRRQYEPTMVIEPAPIQGDTVASNEAPPIHRIPPTPGTKRTYKSSEDQPPSHAYFPVSNYQ